MAELADAVYDNPCWETREPIDAPEVLEGFRSSGVERRLRALGAGPPGPATAGPGWLAQAADEIGAVGLRHCGNHRYAWAIDARRWRTVIASRTLPYPKRVDA